MSFSVKVDPSDLPRKHHSGWNWFNLIFPRGAQSPYKKMKNTRDITESVKFINLFCLKFFKNVWISSQSQYWKSNIILWMPKLLEYGPEGEVQEWNVAFGLVKKSFGIPKMKLDFQNIYWEFRSLGHQKLDVEFWSFQHLQFNVAIVQLLSATLMQNNWNMPFMSNCWNVIQKTLNWRLFDYITTEICNKSTHWINWICYNKQTLTLCKDACMKSQNYIYYQFCIM